MIDLPPQASMRAYQDYIHALEALHGWLDVDLVESCFLMGEEVGELFKAIRRHRGMFNEPAKARAGAEAVEVDEALSASRAAVAEEIVDVFNYLCALANRLDIDLEAAFREKNAMNQRRVWGAKTGGGVDSGA
ncbi:hypothetical protein KKF91_16165 [Myxococcota bacterium]|nr:hypothetical protein [Myxococcota bacterium]MBU1432076.1 hypothetical protein [Myxococcota bacterium]MBU1897782.1 hypothetical protein [Myxococcota bacterium]